MTTKLLIAGQEMDSSARPLEVTYPWNPATEVGACHTLNTDQIELVFENAQKGYEAFRFSKPMERSAILSKLADLLLAEKETLAKMITLETGKPIKLSRGEVDRAVVVARGYAEALDHQEETWLYVQDRKAVIKRFPYGPVFAITPFNFPLNLVMHKLAPAIACGTSFTVKPASKTPLTALYLGKLAANAGYPYISVIPCNGATAERMIEANRFQKISFTGSSEVGWRIRQLAPKASLSLELGSNSACIIDDFSFGLEKIAQRCADSAFQFAGQSCISLQRVYVKQELHDDFMQALIGTTNRIQVGDPMEPTTDLGPLISLGDVQRMGEMIQDALVKGGHIAVGGNTLNATTYMPTVLNQVTHEMAAVKEEAFAPLMVVHPYQQFEEALDWVNSSEFGLHAGIFTADTVKALRAFEVLEVGGLLHNDTPTTRLDYLPYGGVKESGFGREGIICGIKEMTYPKTFIARQ